MTTDMTLGALYRTVRARFRAAGLETPEMDAKLLLSFVLGCAPDDVLLKPETPALESPMLTAVVERRLRREPVSRIVGQREFYGLSFEITPDVLDPRPDTEALVDAARTFIASSGKVDVRMLDVCTGSGCIPLSLLSVYPRGTAVASDISPAALAVAMRNAARLGLDARISFVEGAWFLPVPAGIRFDVITCNPPYIPTRDIESLDADVKSYDPMLALDGGAHGLDAYATLFPQVLDYLAPGGRAFFEIGVLQAPDVVRCAEDCGLRVHDVVRDFGGVERVVCVS